MAKMEDLNAFLVERLMSAAREIFEAVSDAVSEYRRETARAEQENRRLRERLAEIGASGERRAADLLPSHAEASHVEQDSQQTPVDSDPSEFKLELATIKREIESPPVPNNASPCSKRARTEEFPCPSLTPGEVEEKDETITIKQEQHDSQHDSQLACCDTSSSISVPPVGSSRALTRSAIMKQEPCVCPPNEETFSDPSCVTAPLQNHHDRAQTCKVCGTPFAKCVCLSRHKKVVQEKGKTYCCKLCGKCYRQPNSLTVHFRKHTGEKPFRCKFCGRTFMRKGHCNDHEKVHTGEKRYICPVCGKRYVQSSALKSHVRNKH